MLPTRGFLARPATEVAPRLLGWTISHSTAEGTVAVELTEVEAYLGRSDPASHAYRGPSQRNRVMFGPPGHLYAYRSYGIHTCLNIVTGADGEASAVLLRAGRIVYGAELARARRGDRVADHALARGPGCVGQALGIEVADSGADLLVRPSFGLLPGPPIARARISIGPRVGVSRAHTVPLRFWVSGDPTVSAYRRSARVLD